MINHGRHGQISHGCLAGLLDLQTVDLDYTSKRWTLVLRTFREPQRVDVRTLQKCAPGPPSLLLFMPFPVQGHIRHPLSAIRECCISMYMGAGIC